MIESLPPLIGPEPRLLILGSIPGPESLRLGQYYAHPRNAFWPMLFALAGEPLPSDYPSRQALILSRPLALWDVLGRCERQGALDAQIRKGEPNDLAGLLARYPSLERVALNGAKAASEFGKLGLSIPSMRLPSTSPAYAAMGLEAKTEAWREAIGSYLRLK